MVLPVTVPPLLPLLIIHHLLMIDGAGQTRTEVISMREMIVLELERVGDEESVV
jgi:hypothetical protein